MSFLYGVVGIAQHAASRSSSIRPNVPVLKNEGTSTEALQLQLRLGASAVYSEPEKDWAMLDARYHMGASNTELPGYFHRRQACGFLKVLI